MCGADKFSAYFVDLPAMESLRVGAESLRHCATVYVFGAVAPNCDFGALSFLSLSYATVLTQNPLEDAPEDDPPDNESSFIDDGG